MNLRRIAITALVAGCASAGAVAFAQTPQDKTPDTKTESAAPVQAQSLSSAPVVSANESSRAEAYYNFTMGHIYEQQYEATSSAEYATKAIEAYKKAYALDPKSPVIGERLAEMYWKAQRLREAVNEAQEILKRDPNDVQSRRLLGRIYLRGLGDFNGGNGQSETVNQAIEQYREIYRLDPGDTESALWLARLYRLQNDHDKAGSEEHPEKRSGE
jgi:tetratricopeptide (TPR) repeat protein